ncbi:hypothetical protein [Rhizobium sp. L245/93]|uniref:hypothetical protein n=1 Tax=Rhizobium sp. L245/93 TaxID=2819998 RepID=UPI001ADB4659|nr:hypothetical protein [Rhizobium sp. L245/93]MBO9166798.1 hypothetical protein [Rhizobium sp. L245/93]
MHGPRTSDTGNRVRQTTWAFADGRLEDMAVLEWAAGLSPDHEPERSSLRDLFYHRVKGIAEPFALAWRCVFEYWQRPDAETNHEKYLIRRELKQGGTQREIIQLIVDAIRPSLKIETSKRYKSLSGEKPPEKPKLLRHLIWASISSGDRLTPKDIDLDQISDRNFLFELAMALNTALLSGLNLGRMIGSISESMDMTNWQVQRVYYVPAAQFPVGGGEPDRHRDGFAPVTKLMFAVTERLASIDVAAARRIVSSWDSGEWKLYRRLWAAAARNPDLISPDEVSTFLETVDDIEFWRPGTFPEIAELRAVRWGDFSAATAARLEKRLLKGEPLKLIPKSVDKADRAGFRQHRIRIELQRIQAAGGQLSEKAVGWLNDIIQQGGEGSEVNLTFGFSEGVRMLRGEHRSEASFDGILSPKLLDELAAMIGNGGWDDRTQQASDYIARNPSDILALLEMAPDTVVSAKVWQAFGYGFRPSDLNVGPDKALPENQEKIPIAVRACEAIAHLGPVVLKGAIDGLASFANSWDKLLQDGDAFLAAWLTLWPIAVTAANENADVSQPLGDRAYTSPVGQLLFALSGWPTVRAGDGAFAAGPWPKILSAVSEATGEARLEAQYILTRDIGYYYIADPAWTTANLIEPLKTAPTDGGTLELWGAFGSGDLPGPEVLLELAEPLVAAAISSDLPTQVRGDLAERLILSILLSARDQQPPPVSINLAQQMLRMGGDTVRREAISAMHVFLKGGEDADIARRFDVVASTFREVWPKELTLSSRQVSEGLAELPAAAGPYYAEAAQLVLPYLTPFDCWSLFDYGVLDSNAMDNRLSVINDHAKASAFLAILDKTIGSEEGAIIPNGLEGALLHIAKVAPKLEKDVRFQRLLTISRR